MATRSAKKLFLITLGLGALLSTSADAKRISEKEASQVAGKFLTTKSGLYKKAPAIANQKSVFTPKMGQDALFYVFNNAGSGGFTIISGDDELPQVLGFTTEGTFDEKTLHPSIQYWLGEYEREIEYFYRTGKGARVISGDTSETIAPLLTTTWNQSSPYNNLCPEVNGARSVTGCVATAMAQNINYYEWPQKGEGSRNGINFANTTYDYAHMLDNYESVQYTNQEALAVATLMRHCGAAVDMNYSPSASGAVDQMIQYGLINHFRYNPGTRLLYRDYMSVNDWEQLIYNELKNNGPVIMCGQADGGGHCFNVDGYQGNGYFHLNWGWNGYYNGYFLLFALNPEGGGIGSYDGGYNSSQSAIVDMSPRGTKDTPKQTGLICNAPLRYNVNDQCLKAATPNAIVYNGTGNTQYVYLGAVLEKDDDPSEVYYSRLYEGDDLPPYYGYSSIPVDLNNSIPNGKYRIRACTSPDGTKIDIVNTPIYVPDYDLVNVVNGAIVSRENVDYARSTTLMNTRVDGLDHLRSGMASTLLLTIANVEGPDFRNNITIDLINSEGTSILNSTAEAIIPAGYSRDIDVPVTLGSDVPTGDYTLRVSNGSNVINERTVTVKPALEESADEEANVILTAFSPNYNIKGAIYNASITLSNVATKAIAFNAYFILYDSNFNQIRSLKAEALRITKGNSLSARFNMGNLNLDPDTYYWRVYIEESRTSYFASGNVPFNVVEHGIREGDVIFDRLIDANQVSIGEVKGGRYSDEVVIPEHMSDGSPVTRVDGSAFTFADEITSVSIPASVEEIGSGAFYKASQLNSLTFAGENAPVLGRNALNEEATQNTLIYLPDGRANAYKATPGWENIFLPSWTFNADPVLTVEGFELNTPWYVGAGEELTVNISGGNGATIYAYISLSDDTSELYRSTDGTFTLPALGLLKGRVSFAPENSCVEGILSEISTADLYSINGLLIKKGAKLCEVLTCPAGVYIYGGKKIVIR